MGRGARAAGDGTPTARRAGSGVEAASLEALLTRFRERVEISASERDDVIVLHMIRTVAADRGSGRASEALRALCEYADRTGQTVALTPEPVTHGREQRGLPKTALTAWYRKHGFVANRGANKDWRARETMVRRPRTG